MDTGSDKVCEKWSMKKEFCTESGLSFSFSLKCSVLKPFIVTLTKWQAIISQWKFYLSSKPFCWQNFVNHSNEKDF